MTLQVWVSEALVQNCSRLIALLQKATGKETKYRTELDSDEKDIAFKMIRNNATEVCRLHARTLATLVSSVLASAGWFLTAV